MRRDRLQKLADSMGVELQIRISPDEGDVEGWTPPGKVFNCNGCHVIVANHPDGGWVSELYDRIAFDLSDGLSDCDEADCEYCD